MLDKWFATIKCKYFSVYYDEVNPQTCKFHGECKHQEAVIIIL